MTFLDRLKTKADAETSQTSTATKSKGKLPELELGMISDVKNLYQTKPDNRGRSTWVDKYPDDLEEAAENADTAQYALVIRNKKCYDGRKKLQVDSIIVQSPLLKKVLGSVLKDYPGITTNLNRLTFTAPFEAFVHRWNWLADAVKTEEDLDTKAHLDLFYAILEGELHDDIKAKDDFILNGVITHDKCWMIFEPGNLIFTFVNGQKSAVRLSSGSYINNSCGSFYRLDCQLIDWDGESFGLGSCSIKIWDFLGTAKITKLSAFPLGYHPAVDKVKEELIQRGKSFENFQGYHYKSYEGIAIGEGPWGLIKYNVSMLWYMTVSKVLPIYTCLG